VRVMQEETGARQRDPRAFTEEERRAFRAQQDYFEQQARQEQDRRRLWDLYKVALPLVGSAGEELRAELAMDAAKVYLARWRAETETVDEDNLPTFTATGLP